MNFKILQDNVGKPKLCIDLSKLAYSKDLIGGTCFTSDNSNVGQFTIDRDKVYIEYDWDKLKECYPNSSEYQTTVSINAKANEKKNETTTGTSNNKNETTASHTSNNATTKASVTTKASATTKAPETKEPETQAQETQAPADDGGDNGENGGE